MTSPAPDSLDLSRTPFATLRCHCGNFGQEASRQPSCALINCERIFDRLRLSHRALPLRRFERRLNQGGDTAKSQTPADEFAHRDFVRGIEDCRRRPAGRERLARQRQSGKTDQVRFFKGQSGEAGKIKSRCGSAHACRPSQTMGNRNPHVRRAELGDHRAVAEFYQAVHNRLRVNDHVELVDCQAEQVVSLDQLKALIHEGR